MRKQAVIRETKDLFGRREVTFAERTCYKRPAKPRNREEELSKKRIRSWHESLEGIWQDYNNRILPEVKAMNLVRKYELKIEHEELRLRGAF